MKDVFSLKTKNAIIINIKGRIILALFVLLADAGAIILGIGGMAFLAPEPLQPMSIDEMFLLFVFCVLDAILLVWCAFLVVDNYAAEGPMLAIDFVGLLMASVLLMTSKMNHLVIGVAWNFIAAITFVCLSVLIYIRWRE